MAQQGLHDHGVSAHPGKRREQVNRADQAPREIPSDSAAGGFALDEMFHVRKGLSRPLAIPGLSGDTRSGREPRGRGGKVPGMNRYSKKAQLAETETGVSARKIERQSLAGLIGDDLDGPALVAHVRALDTVSTQGQDAETTSLLLARRFGLGCPILPRAILRALCLDDEASSDFCRPVDRREDGEASDTGWEEIERRATAIEDGWPSPPGSDAAHLESELARRLQAASPELGEPEESLMHSVVTTVAAMAAGEPVMLTTPLLALAGEDVPSLVEKACAGAPPPRIVDEQGLSFEHVIGTLNFEPSGVSRYITTTPPAQLARDAYTMGRSDIMALIAPLFRDERRADIAAAVLGPLLAAIGSDGGSPLLRSLIAALPAAEKPA